MVTAVAQYKHEQKIREYKQKFTPAFTNAIHHFERSHVYERSAARHALKRHGIIAKRGTEHKLINIMAWHVLATKSNHHTLAEFNEDPIREAWEQYFKREVGIWRWLYN